jgi:hypothetical protein
VSSTQSTSTFWSLEPMATAGWASGYSPGSHEICCARGRSAASSPTNLDRFCRKGTETIEIWSATSQSIANHITDLEQRRGRITAWRAVLKAPSGHYCIGLYEVNVRLALPNGREVSIAPHSAAGTRVLQIWISPSRDALKRARRGVPCHAGCTLGYGFSIAVVAASTPTRRGSLGRWCRLRHLVQLVPHANRPQSR